MLQEEAADHEAGHASQAAANGAPLYERQDSFEPPDAARYIPSPYVWALPACSSAEMMPKAGPEASPQHAALCSVVLRWY